jgi:hypothetical protein
MLEAAVDSQRWAVEGGNLHIEFGRMVEEGMFAHNSAAHTQEAEAVHMLVRRVEEAAHIEAVQKVVVHIDPEGSSAGLVFEELEVEEPVADHRDYFEAEYRDYSVFVAERVAESGLGLELAVELA